MVLEPKKQCVSEGMTLRHALLLCFVKEGRELGFPSGELREDGEGKKRVPRGRSLGFSLGELGEDG